MQRRAPRLLLTRLSSRGQVRREAGSTPWLGGVPTTASISFSFPCRLANLHHVLGERRIHSLEPVRRAARDNNDVAGNEPARLAVTIGRPTREHWMVQTFSGLRLSRWGHCAFQFSWLALSVKDLTEAQRQGGHVGDQEYPQAEENEERQHRAPDFYQGSLKAQGA